MNLIIYEFCIQGADSNFWGSGEKWACQLAKRHVNSPPVEDTVNYLAKLQKCYPFNSFPSYFLFGKLYIPWKLGFNI